MALFRLLFLAVSASAKVLLITGATGRLGVELYNQAKASGEFSEVRALVTNCTKAVESLNATCGDAGVFEGDVTDAASLAAAMDGVDAVAIAVGASPGDDADRQRAVEFYGVENTAAALWQARGTTSPKDRQVVLCSSMGTTQPDPSPGTGGSILFWKLNAEAQLLTARLKTVVVKPCGLSKAAPSTHELVIGHDDTLLSLKVPLVPRSDVARVMLAAIRRGDSKLRFDLCAKVGGTATVDLDGLLDEAAYPL
ncbi:hypothetical protein M885DRAFT_479976 [Pelagophyceae sp. CCMP2097]|nr:hypothetical protein M885DRAFT_479976 [Pelagophyceae sp. CCMP2097]